VRFLLHELLHVGSRILFRCPPDFPDQDHPFRAGILIEELQRVHEARADDRITPDADAG